MKVIYKAFDGEEFNTESACLEYEEKRGKCGRCFDNTGKETDKIDDCVFVYFSTPEEMKNFIHYNEECGADTTGLDIIDFDENSIWIWSKGKFVQFRYYSQFALRGLGEAIKNLLPEEERKENA